MKLSKTPNNQGIGGKKPIDWFSFVTDERGKLAIPIGPRFQVDIPSWNPPSSKSRLTIGDTELEDENKWLSIPVWPLKGRSQNTYHDTIGKGRPWGCICAFPGSIECVRQHVYDKRLQLKIELGPAFWKWRFDVMGEDVSKVWNSEEQRKFDYIVKKNLTSLDTSFVKVASQCFPCQSKGNIISYYLNVYIPRRISVQTRSSCNIVDSDDDNDDDDHHDDDDEHDHDHDHHYRHRGDGEDIARPKGPLKRLQADFTSSTCKYMKTAYLTSCR
ncbi:AT-rich interactive domain-containing protein 1-like [Salvia miltiorrhiza]|uniref:AT-rich interactive domain-containing protein 1-like n=1 Tax=Salvia miltiorrhiza TaxID=226208 RepID=UPI0025AD4A8E|nr:AT-rich interactive domain-containing protein 1-like [Salvia miltiorrhiza]XP_057772451.1 AT-rich interactive domain-containing protein 1-like [Salvia miltiorrhiza]